MGEDDLLCSIEDAILEKPEAGATLAGTGGIRKLRATDPSPSRQKGKRGGLRVLYLDLPDREITYLPYAYGKTEVKDITADEKKIFKALVAQIKGERI